MFEETYILLIKFGIFDDFSVLKRSDINQKSSIRGNSDIMDISFFEAKNDLYA
jgi:hypothetical protein